MWSGVVTACPSAAAADRQIATSVAKDRERPFVVDAGARQVVAVGTRFSVRRDAHELRVVVTEGTVRLQPAKGDRNPQATALLPAGSVALISLLNPVSATLLGVAFAAEAFGLPQAVGMALVLGGVLLGQFGRARPSSEGEVSRRP